MLVLGGMSLCESLVFSLCCSAESPQKLKDKILLPGPHPGCWVDLGLEGGEEWRGGSGRGEVWSQWPRKHLPRLWCKMLVLVGHRDWSVGRKSCCRGSGLAGYVLGHWKCRRKAEVFERTLDAEEDLPAMRGLATARYGWFLPLAKHQDLLGVSFWKVGSPQECFFFSPWKSRRHL